MQAIDANGTCTGPRRPDGPAVQPLTLVVRHAEAVGIAAALAQANGDRAAAAGLLGISVATLQRRVATLRARAERRWAPAASGASTMFTDALAVAEGERFR